MADKSPRQSMTKKSTKNIKGKRAAKKDQAERGRSATAQAVTGR